MGEDQRHRVLIVDDDPVCARLVTRILDENGFEPRATLHSKAALEHARKFKPALIILDFVMPQLQGPDLAILLKSDPELRQLPIVFLSGKTDQAHHEIAEFTGGVRYLHKPIEADYLIRTLRELLPVAS